MRIVLFILTAALFIGGCDAVSFQKMALYDKYEEPPPMAKTNPIIFDETVGTMWNSFEDCGEFAVTQETAYEGKSSIKLSWDKSKGCDWIGFGNSFNNWQPTDLSQSRFELALSFYARTQSKTAKAIPIVANLEDFAGGGSYYFIDAKKYLEGLELDTSWKQIIVPLWHFPVGEEVVDIYAIKQMQFQLEGAGSFYLDDLKLIEYSEELYAQQRQRVESMKPKGEENQTVYREGKILDDAWGVSGSPCSTLEEKTDEAGNTSIFWKFNAKDCSWAKWGLNWNDWYQINLRGLEEQGKISFRFKGSKDAAFTVRLECFTGANAIIYKSPIISADSWQHVEVPLNTLDLKGKKFALDQVKQLLFEGIGAGEIYIDDVKISKE